MMAPSKINGGLPRGVVLVLLLNLSIVLGNQYNKNDIARSIYMTTGSHMKQGGWRPILSSDNINPYNFAGILGGQSIGQKLLTGPALIETKVISPHIVSVSPYTNDIFGNGILSTSTRPLVTRDANKMTTIAQSYKNTMFPQSNVNLNSPVNSYMNPFALPTGPGISAYKLNPGYQFDNNIFIKHQQPMTHRPMFTKAQGQMMLGKRIKQNQMLQFAANNYHQAIQTYQNSLKNQRPIDTYKRPTDNYSRPHNGNFQKVNPQESLLTQTKSKPVQSGQNVAAVTYKPPINSHFQHFGIKEEPFGPIPSSILGSFSSFGHASVKARDPVYPNKINYVSSTTTRAPPTSTQTFSPVSTYSTIANYPTQEPKHVPKQQNIRNVNDDFTKNLVPPPKVVSISSFPDRTKEDLRPVMKGSFIPSPPDPLNKYQNAPEVKPINSNIKANFVYKTNHGTKRPDVTSFFDPEPSVSTSVPLDAQSTNVVPDKLLVQLPPPHTSVNNFNTQPIKFDNIGLKENYHIHHGKNPVKYDDFKYFSPTRGQELFGSKHKFNYESNTNLPNKGSYEVTETWGSSGEINTQPTLHTWINKPAQSYKHYNIDLKPPPPPFKLSIGQDDRLIPVSFPPHYKPSDVKGPQIDISSTYSTISDEDNNKHKTFYTQLENTLSSLDDFQKKPFGDETFDLAAPFNLTYEEEEEEEKPQVSSTPAFEETYVPNKRKPLKNKVTVETTTTNIIEEDFNEFTTKYETYKEQTHEAENDLQANELPTIPPNKHFKRPITTTPVPIETWEEKLRKKNKNRRRRPSKFSTTTEEPIHETAVYTDHPVRSHRYRTTTLPSEVVEEVTKSVVKSRVRLPHHKLRLTTKPTSQPELTSSAQPTIVPTAPVTLRPKLHSRVRLTTLSSLDFEDLAETTTVSRGLKTSDSGTKQSSIMKIAKDNHFNRSPAIKQHSNSYEQFNETPDYSHKQDEKDTPTSDISLHTYEHKYSAQKLQNENSDSSNSEETNISSELNIENTSPSQEITRSEQLFTEQKLGNRGNIKSDNKNKYDQQNLESLENFDSISTTPVSSTKGHRLKLKPGKYDTNRPRFSVKDYRNRLNQYSSTSTEKPNTSSESSLSRLRFPNRSRFPSFKDQRVESSKPVGTEVITTTEAPRKKFTPKDPRHKDEKIEEQEIENKTESPKITSTEPTENEIVKKPLLKLRNGIRREHNRTRLTTTTTTTTTESSAEAEKPVSAPINTYTNLKRPVVSIRKRLPTKNETVEELPLEAVSTSTEIVITVEEKIETSTEKHTSETAIMKIAKDERKHTSEDTTENTSMDPSQRVSDLTLAASKEYNTPGLFKSVSPNTRKVPNYFTIATDDPILPIEAFFPQLNQKKES